MTHRALIFMIWASATVSILAQEDKPKNLTKPSTVEAVTQDRDKAIYDWQKRHAEVLELGKQGPVDVVMIGDSIFHYWAGLPKAPMIRGQASWDELFQGKKAANLGFGWDRVENVLWRVKNGELSDLKPSVIVLSIGTNNLELNTAAEIRTGIQAVCQEIHKALPESTIHVIGLLPRTLPAKNQCSPSQVNSQLHHHLSGKNKIHFHDLTHLFLDNQDQLVAELFSDGLHPNEKGYSLLAKGLREVIFR